MMARGSVRDDEGQPIEDGDVYSCNLTFTFHPYPLLLLLASPQREDTTPQPSVGPLPTSKATARIKSDALPAALQSPPQHTLLCLTLSPNAIA